MAGPSTYEAQQDTKEQAHSNAVRELAKSRNRLKDALSGAEGRGVPAHRVLVNPAPPVPGDATGGRPIPAWADDLRLCHAAAVEFCREVSPYSGHAKEMWEQDLLNVRVPHVAGKRTVTRPRQHNDFVQSELGYIEGTLSLDDVGDWRFLQLTLWCEYDQRWDGTEQLTRREKLHLPVKACDAIYEQLNAILDEISMLAEIREQSATDSDPGRPDDVDVWEEAANE